ncbi:MAG: tetratricopeptide repeat protein [Bacteroidetes bacterium]|nr:tetratricopeptide repeat protein [Bacteroidota bacterium]
MKKFLKINGILLTACFFTIFGCQESTPKKPDNEAVLNRPPFAALTDSIKRFPDDADLYFRRAERLSQNNLTDIATADYKKAWDLKQEVLTGMHYASNLGINSQLDEEIQLLLDCIKKFPEENGFKRLLGETYIDAGRTKEALGIYDEAIKTDSLNFEAWYEKGRLLEQSRDTSGAILAFKKAYTLQPIPMYAMELAHVYAEAKNPLALQICDRVLEYDSAHELTDPFFIKGIYYSNTKQYKPAAIQFDSCIKRDWKFTEAYIEKGIAFFKQKDYDTALSTFRMAATVSNTEPDPYFWIGRCLEAKNNKQQAAEYYQRAVELDRNFVEAKEALRRVGG